MTRDRLRTVVCAIALGDLAREDVRSRKRVCVVGSRAGFELLGAVAGRAFSPRVLPGSARSRSWGPPEVSLSSVTS
ncbi:MAG: hypothetical protein ABSA14_01910 [Acidimicrobiales bacterium]